MTETHQRTLARMITYRITAWLITIPVSWWLTGNLGQATTFSTVLHLLLSLDYYIHERIWLKVRWGVLDEPPTSP